MPYLVLAYACIALGALGIFLPVLPTTPFLLVAAWAAPKASPRLDAWLHRHPRFGPVLRAWRDERAIPTRAKWLACSMLLASWLFMLATAATPWVPAATGVLFLCIGTYVCTRRTPTRERSARRRED